MSKIKKIAQYELPSGHETKLLSLEVTIDNNANTNPDICIYVEDSKYMLNPIFPRSERLIIIEDFGKPFISINEW